MTSPQHPIRHALVSVADKTGIVPFAADKLIAKGRRIAAHLFVAGVMAQLSEGHGYAQSPSDSGTASRTLEVPDRYRAAQNFSSNCLSFDSLKVRERCGLMSLAAHSRCTLDAEMPAADRAKKYRTDPGYRSWPGKRVFPLTVKTRRWREGDSNPRCLAG
jgi:hypothetical protein